MGLGKAIPYLIFIIKPNILLHLPKPGIWMKYIKVIIGFMLLISLLWLGKLLINHYVDTDKKYQTNDSPIQWEEFNKEKIIQYLNNDHKVFIDITAEWCINCKINKKLVLDDIEVQDLFKIGNIKFMRDDWPLSMHGWPTQERQYPNNIKHLESNYKKVFNLYTPTVF